MKAKFKTTDDKSYHDRHSSEKRDFILEFVRNLSDVKKVYDVGCNNGKISYPLQKELGLDVLGTDFSTKLYPPEDYNFVHGNIVEDNNVYFNDVTLFLSLYHHILGAYSLEKADEVFLKLFLRSKYLIFDTGNLSEHLRSNQYWYKAQLGTFKNEDELLEHFNLPYEVIGSWSCGGGNRKVVVFKNEGSVFDIENTYVTKNFTPHQKEGLVPFQGTLEELKKNEEFKPTIFSKLKWNNKLLFAKKRPQGFYDKDLEPQEIRNIQSVYNTLNANLLLNFYGYNDTHGIIYEWVDDLKYIGKTELSVEDINLIDVNEFEVNGVKKLTDFDR